MVKMEGGKKSKVGTKRGQNPIPEVGFDSGDDEPIGSFLKLKSKEKHKRVKMGLDGGGDKGKTAEKVVVEDEDLAGMDDTLASFRKKLKGPKRNGGGLAVKAGDDIVSDKAKPSGQSLDGCLKSSNVATKLVSKDAEKGHGDVAMVSDCTDKTSKERSKKKNKVAPIPKEAGVKYMCNYIPYSMEKEAAVNPLDDSLSAFFRKAQSGLIRKSHSTLKVETEMETQATDDWQSSSSSGVLEDPLAECNGRSRSAFKVVKTTGEFSGMHVEPARGATDETAVNQGSSYIEPPLSDCGLQNVICPESTQELPSDPPISGGTSQFEDNIEGASCVAVSEDPAPSFLLHTSQSKSRTCSKEVSSSLGGESYYPDNKKIAGSPLEPAGSSAKLNLISGGSERPFSVLNVKEIDKVEDRVENNSIGRIVPHDVGEGSSLLSTPEHTEISQFDGCVGTGVAQKPSLELDGSLRSTSGGSLNPVDGFNTNQFESKQSTFFNHDSTTTDPGHIGEGLGKFTSISPKMDDPSPDGRFSQPSKQGTKKSEPSDPMKNHVKSLVKAEFSYNLSQEANLEKSAALNERHGSALSQNQLSNEAPSVAYPLNHADGYGAEEAEECSSPNTPGHLDRYAEDSEDVSKLESKDNKLSDYPRSARKFKKRRHGDMAYEGDAAWDILLHEQDDIVVGRQLGDPRDKFTVCSDSGAAAAVSVGLKARAVGPVEKIRFKEVLKRKWGLQEYLECRNHILSLWNKDVSRILPLSDCGVIEYPSVDESALASLVHDVYTFLDQCGYINFGVASRKDKAETGDCHDLKLFKEENLWGEAGVSVADTEDGVSYILGNVKTSNNALELKNDLESDIEKGAARSITDGKYVGLQASNISSPTRPQECTSDAYQGNGHYDFKALERMANFDSTCSISTSKDENGRFLTVAPPDLFTLNEAKVVGAKSAVHSESPTDSSDLQRTAIDSETGVMPGDSEAKRKIIIVGAGPAGLTAARHLQRQGFLVTVLEARSRIGGRVFTDRSSLSVPVDLGASIITGVEADVATERRADPSSLICAQLGLELTVLNSDCPLYDTVTCQKVPADLDEALEAEYNSLLDDMVLLVAQKGEHAMKMSLEEGLEYALKMRCLARSGRTYLDHKPIDAFEGSEKFPTAEVPEKYNSKAETLSPLERRVMDWHFANLEYGCAALLKEVSLPYWNQDDEYGGFGGAHCMIKGGYSAVAESLAGGIFIHLNHVVTDISYGHNNSVADGDQSVKVKVSTSNGREFSGDAVLITVPLGCLKTDSIRFSPPLPRWKSLSIERLGFGVLNKVVLEFPEVFWDENIDYFGSTAEETNLRGQCFMFWNVKKTVGAPVLIALVVGKAAIDEKLSSSDHVHHALVILRKLFGETRVPEPVASVVTDWGRDPYSYGAYSYVAVGSSGEDYDILGRPVENCLFFAGEATCKEHPDTVGGAMMSGLREAVRIIDIMNTGVDHTAEIEAEESAERHSDTERDEVRDIIMRLEAVELSNVLCKNSLDQAKMLTKEGLLRDMFSKAKTTAGRLHLIKELLNLPVSVLKSLAGTREGLSTLNSWILDSMGKDGTQLLRHCVRLLVRVSTDLLAIRLSGIGKTVKEKVCVHTSRDIRAIASQLVNVWVEIFRKEKAYLRSRTYLTSGKPPLRMHNHAPECKGTQKVLASAGNHSPSNTHTRKLNTKPNRLERTDSKSEVRSSSSQGSGGKQYTAGEESRDFPMSEEEKAAIAAAEAARAAALAAAEAYASSGAKSNMPLPLPKIPSFHKFARREQYARMDESDIKRNWSGGVTGKQDCFSEIDSRNCRVRDWSVDFSAAGVNFESSRVSVDNHSQRSHSNEMASQLNYREHSGESKPIDSSLFTKAWVDSSGSVEGKDYNAIERWQCQAAAANFEFYHQPMHVTDEEDSNVSSKLPNLRHKPFANESSASQVTINKELADDQRRGPDCIKQGVVDYVASLLMPLYKARKIDKDSYKSIMKKTATKVMESTTDSEKTMSVTEFLDFKRKNKIRAFVDNLIERHMSVKPGRQS